MTLWPLACKALTVSCAETGRAGAAEERAGTANARIATAWATKSNIAAVQAIMVHAMFEPPSRCSEARNLDGCDQGSLEVSSSINVRPLISSSTMDPVSRPSAVLRSGSHALTR